MFNKSEITVHFFCKEYCELMLAILTSFKVQWRDDKGGVSSTRNKTVSIRNNYC